MELRELSIIRLVGDGVAWGDLPFPESRGSPEAAKAILMLNGRNPARAKRAAFRAFKKGN